LSPAKSSISETLAKAKRLVLLYGDANPLRIVANVEHVTAAPRPGFSVELITRWGNLELGAQPRLTMAVDGPGADAFFARLSVLGVQQADSTVQTSISTEDARAAISVLRSASQEGYKVARSAIQELGRDGNVDY
jgi:glutaconate CoA-transferase, subunit B